MAPDWGRQMSPQTWKGEVRSPIFWRDVIVEGLASTILMFFVMLIVVTNNENHYKPNTTHFGLFAGFLVYLLIEGYGPISGAHMNPAASFALCAVGHITPVRAACYIASQLCGTAAAAGMGYAVTPASARDQFHALVPAVTMTNAQSVFLEACLSFNLLFVAISVNDAKGRPSVTMPSLAVAFSLGTGIMVAGTHTGGFQNPIVPLGPAIVSGDFNQYWIYWVGPVLGATVGAFAYELTQWIKRRYTPKINTDPRNEKTNIHMGDLAKREELTQLLEELLKDRQSSHHQQSS